MTVLGFPKHSTIESALKEYNEKLTDEQITSISKMTKSEFDKLSKLNIKVTDKMALDIYKLYVEKLFSDMLGKETVNYRMADATGNCMGCRWFSPSWNNESIIGSCNIVTGEILPTDVCDRVEVVGTAPDAATPPATEPATTTPPPPAPQTAKDKLNKLLNKKEHTLKHSFQWALPLELGENSAEDMMLVKGVAMRSGEMKRGERMSKDNLVFAAGAMSAAAMFGLVPLNIDHFEDKLPQKYVDKYGAEINDPYPIGLILDAAASENVSELDGKKYTEVEFIGAVTNPHVYEMIKKGMFKGGSVVDYYRKQICDCGADQSEHTCNKCDIEGSHFLQHTLILEEVANSEGTWVAAVNAKDIGTIIAKPSDARMEEMKANIKNDLKSKAIVSIIKSAQRKHSTYELDTYMNEDGTWINGKESIIAFLKDEKSLSDITASDMAEYLWNNPTILTQYQYENMSADDLVAWFFHIQMMAFKAKQLQMAKQVAALSALQHNADGLAILKNLKQLSQEEVNYSPDAASKCSGCRWFLPLDAENLQGEGLCAIVEGDIIGTSGCDRFEAAEMGEEQPPVEGEEGAAAEGEAENAEVPMLEDGSCPEGYVANADGTACMIPKVAAQKLKRNVGVEKNPQNHKGDVDNQLALEIAADKKTLASMKVLNTKQHAEYMSLKSNIQRKEHTLRQGGL